MKRAGLWLTVVMALALGCGEDGDGSQPVGGAGEGGSGASPGGSTGGSSQTDGSGGEGTGGDLVTGGSGGGAGAAQPGDGGAAGSGAIGSGGHAGSGPVGVGGAAGSVVVAVGGSAGAPVGVSGAAGSPPTGVGGAAGSGVGGEIGVGGAAGAGQVAGSGGSAGTGDPDPVPTGTPEVDEIRINETVRFQTVDGVGANAYNFPYAEDQGWDWSSVEFVHTELDIQYVRTAPWFGFWEPSNDDADPNTVNWDAFGTDNIPVWHDLPYATYLSGQGIEVLPGIWDVEEWLAGGSPRTIAAGSYAELGESIATYLEWFAQNGVDVPVAEVQNEPTIEAGIQYPSPEALRDAALAVLDQLDQHGLGQVMLHGPNVHAPSPTEEWARVWLADARLRSRTAAVSYHTWWDSDFDLYDGIRQVAEEYGLPVWATEVGYCALASGCFNGANYLLPETWGTAWDYALSYYRAFAWSHASRAYHWSLLGHDAVVSPTGERTPSFYVLKHFANYIPPGARLLETASGDSEVLPLAFLLADGTVTAILINQGTTEKAVQVRSVLDAAWAPQDAIATTESSYESMATASGPLGTPASVQITLPAQSVTSLRLVVP